MQATTLYKRACLIEVEVWMLFQLIEREVVNVEFLHIIIAQNDILQSLWRYAFDIKQLVYINITAKSIAVVNYRPSITAPYPRHPFQRRSVGSVECDMLTNG